MRKIYTGIDFGSYSIKIVVSEVVNNKFHVLAASNTRCKGIKKGIIVDQEEVKPYLLKAKQDVEEMLGMKLTEAIVTVSSEDRKFDIVDGKVNVESESKIIDSEDVIHVFQDATIGKVEEGYELITITPIMFTVDHKEETKDPKGITGDVLSVKAVITSIPKQNYKIVMELMKECGMQIVDATFDAVGDYYEARNLDLDSCVSAIINIGYSKMELSIFNKGIMIKNKTIENGSKLIDKDLSYMYKIKVGQARKLKENFAVSNTRYADINDTIDIVNKEGETVTINQVEVSQIVEARLLDLLQIAKKEINVLTNRQISYIMITGGISELTGFEYVVENVFDKRGSILDMKTMGIRNNMYSSCYGIIKYFHNKLELRGLSYSMMKNKNDNALPKEKVPGNHIISKVFGYFSGE